MNRDQLIRFIDDWYRSSDFSHSANAEMDFSADSDQSPWSPSPSWNDDHQHLEVIPPGISGVTYFNEPNPVAYRHVDCPLPVVPCQPYGPRSSEVFALSHHLSLRPLPPPPPPPQALSYGAYDGWNCAYGSRIGLEGTRWLDFMHYLGNHYCLNPVVVKILSFLNGADLAAMSETSREWRDLVNFWPLAKQKRDRHLAHVESEKENGLRAVRSARRPVDRGSKRKILSDVTNVVGCSSPAKKTKPASSRSFFIDQLLR